MRDERPGAGKTEPALCSGQAPIGSRGNGEQRDPPEGGREDTDNDPDDTTE